MKTAIEIQLIIKYEHSLICEDLMPLPFEITSPNIWPHDGDIVVPVKAGLLVHEAQGMHEFMGNHSNFEAVRDLERDGLSSTTCTKVGPTPGLTCTQRQTWL